MIPMISVPHEMVWIRKIFAEESASLKIPIEFPIGMMIEVPSVALRLRDFNHVADFYSIGSNDLTQYALAADRTNAQVSGLADWKDPGLMRMMEIAVREAQIAHRPVGVCGEMASDIDATNFLVDLQPLSFSVAPSSIPKIRRLISQTLGQKDEPRASAPPERFS